MESMTRELGALGHRLFNHRAKSEQLGMGFFNLSTMTAQAGATIEAVNAIPLTHEASRVRRADAELASAKLELGVTQMRAEWRGFVSEVEELLASLEAVPLLSRCPD
jgi:multidrug resistance efflux pump